MDGNDERALTNILFAAGYRGGTLSAEVHRRAKLDGRGRVTELDLTCCEFLSLPSDIADLTELTWLDLTYCKRLAEIPPEMGELSHLTRLDLYCCSRLKKLPPELGRLPLLSQLDLFGCDAMTLPPADVRSAKDAVPFLRSLLRLLEDPVGSVNELQDDPRLLGAAAGDPAFAPSLGVAVDADRTLADIIVDHNRKKTVLDVACDTCRVEMEEALFFHRRYEIEDRPAYESETSAVYFALDHRPNRGDAAPMPVALKFPYDKKRFLAERATRAYDKQEEEANHNPRFSEHYVIQALHDHDGDVDEEFRQAAKRRRLPSPYCLVLERGDRNLLDAIHNEYLSHNTERVRIILEDLARALAYLHHCGYVHCNFKPRNVVRSSRAEDHGKWKLVDLTSATRMGDAMPRMSRFAYLPPEMVQKTSNNNGQQQQSQGQHFHRGNKPIAHESIDAWSFGAVMYRLIAGASLIEGTDDHDKLREGGLATLRGWDAESLRSKLAIITDQATRDLLYQLLQRDPARRPSMEEVLGHDFFASMHLPQ